MIKWEAEDGHLHLEVVGRDGEVVKEFFAPLEALYGAMEQEEPGEGEKLLEEIAAAIQEGKVQKWAKEGKI